MKKGIFKDKKIVDTNSVGKGKSLSSTDVSTEFNISNDAENVNINSTQESGEYSETSRKKLTANTCIAFLPKNKESKTSHGLYMPW